MNNKIYIFSEGRFQVVSEAAKAWPGLKLEMNGNDNRLIVADDCQFHETVLKVKGNKCFCVLDRSQFSFCEIEINNGGRLVFGSGNETERATICVEDGASIIIQNDNIFRPGSYIYAARYPQITSFENEQISIPASGSLRIGSNNWIGERSRLIGNASIEDNSIFASGAVILSPLKESNIFVSGNPGRIEARNVSWKREAVSGTRNARGSDKAVLPFVSDAIQKDWPPVFDDCWYMTNALISDMSREDAERHFWNEGIKNGIAGSSLACATDFWKFLNNRFKDKKVLECGPGHSPKFAGTNVRYFDMRSAEELSKWAAANKFKNAKVPELIHFVSPNGDLGVVQSKYDLIFSSHNIEHVVDLVGHLQDIGSLLESGGIFAYSVPDRQFTFDYFRKETTIAEVIGQHFSPTANHPLQAVLGFRIEGCHNDTGRHWAGDHGPIPLNLDWVGQVLKMYDANALDDIHRWIFTRNSFEKLFNDLFRLGLSPLYPLRVYNVVKGYNIFNAVFIKNDGETECHNLH